MKLKVSSSISLLLASASCVVSSSPGLVYKQTPIEVWKEPFNAVGVGNGAFLHKDLLAVVANNGNVRGYNTTAEGGQVIWTFVPLAAQDGATVRCQSGIRFFERVGETFLTYSIIETLGETIKSRILVLTLNGAKVLETSFLLGEASGTPQVSSDGRYIATTHNDGQEGHFSFFDTDSPNSPVGPLFEYKSELQAFNESTPFSDLGFFPNPGEGFYDSPPFHNGNNNNNDLFLWMTDTNTNVTNDNGFPMAGKGQMYVFQFPRDYNHSGIGLQVFRIGNIRNFQSPTAPTIADDGKTMYWGMVRGEVRAWKESRKFSRGHTSIAKLKRGSPPHIAPRAEITLNNDTVFGVGSSNLVWKASSDLSNLTWVETDAIVSHQVLVTADSKYVFYGTQAGTLTMANSTDLEPVWQVGDSSILIQSIEGEMALSETMLYLATNEGEGAGHVLGLRIADYATPEPSEPPSVQPTSFPTKTPTSLPTTTFPTPSPTDVPTTAIPTAHNVSPEPTMDLGLEEAITERPALSATAPPTTASSTQTSRIEQKKTSGSIRVKPDLAFLVGTFLLVAAAST